MSSSPFDYGTDCSTFVREDGVADLDPTFALIDGVRVVAEQQARGLMTPRGSMADDPDTVDLKEHESAQMTQRTLSALQTVIESNARQDERVASVEVEVTNPAPFELRVAMHGETAAGPFETVVQSGAAGDLVGVVDT
jgi:hypothetical protein